MQAIKRKSNSSPCSIVNTISFKNEELCNAYITKEMTFDISNLQVDGDKVQLNITNCNENILYDLIVRTIYSRILNKNIYIALQDCWYV